MNYQIIPPEDLLQTRVALPLSKSISNRVLIMTALSKGSTCVPEVANCDDTKAILSALSSESKEVNVGAAGTAMRFLTAYFASTEGRETLLDGSERMRKRPIGPLVEALRACGASIEYAGEEGFPPLSISGRKLTGGVISISSNVSSQYISALLMIAPLMKNGLEVTLEGETISTPYIDMTIGLMTEYGIDVARDNKRIIVKEGKYIPRQMHVEADWSAASYWYELEALTSGWITLDGLDRNSLQGDSRVARIFSNLGVETEYDGEDGGIDLIASPELSPRLILNLADTPDLAQTIAVTCSMLGIPFRLTGLRSLHIKETDRIEALASELLKVGIVLDRPDPETIEWDGVRRPITSLPVFETYEDHRMAMSLAPCSIFIPGIIVRNAEVVNKSYPEFWDDLRASGFTLNEVEFKQGSDGTESH